MIGGPPRGELNLQPQTMEAKQDTTEPLKTVGQRLIEVLRRKMLTFPGRAAFGTLTDPTATWHIAAQDQATWRAMMEHTT